MSAGNGDNAQHRDDDLAPGTQAALAKLELVVTRRLDGVLLGDHRGLVPGPGTEPGEAREYQPGDDVRSMDWSVTARTTIPHIRQKVADRELETWIVVDLSASIDIQGRRGSKRDLVQAAIATFGFLTARAGNRVGLVIADGGTPRAMPPSRGAAQVRTLLDHVARAGRNRGRQSAEPAGDTTSNQNTGNAENSGDAASGPRSGLAGALHTLRGVAGRRGMVVVISDFLDPVDWERSLRGFGSRMELVAVHVADALDIALPAIGPALLQDPATGEILEVDVDERSADEYARVAARHRADVHAALRRCAVPVLALRTDRDWVRDVLSFVAIRRLGGLPTGENVSADLPEWEAAG